MNRAMLTIMKKDFYGITSNRRLFSEMLILPMILTVVLPSILICSVYFASDDPDILKLLELLPQGIATDNLELTIAGLIFNYILPTFFLMIPILTSSIMAASSFVGEKEKHTLETLLYCPLTLKQIFQAKVLACFLFSMLVSTLSFVVMVIVLELEVFFFFSNLLLPSVNWVVILCLFSPAISLIAVTLIVRGSAKARSVEESQQSAVFLILPVILFVSGQLAGVLLLNIWILLGLSMICMVLAWIFMRNALGRFTYEKLLM